MPGGGKGPTEGGHHTSCHLSTWSVALGSLGASVITLRGAGAGAFTLQFLLSYWYDSMLRHCAMPRAKECLCRQLTGQGMAASAKVDGGLSPANHVFPWDFASQFEARREV